MYLSQALKENPKNIIDLWIRATIDDWKNGISQFTELKVLQLNWEDKTELPTGLDQLQKLKTLEITGSKLKALPEEIRTLQSLSHLSINKNKKLKTLPNWLSELKNLEIIRFTNCGFTEFPKVLFSLKNLKKISLDGNKILVIPEGIKEFKKLIEFSINKNKLTALPETIGALEQLELLEFEFNNISHFPKTLTQLKKLNTLRFKKNPIAAENIIKTFIPLTELNTKREYRKDNKAHVNYALSLRKMELSEEDLKLFIRFYNHPEAEYKRSELLKICLLRDQANIRYYAIKQLIQQSVKAYQKNPLQAASKLAVLGKTNFKKTKLKKELEELGPSYQSQLNVDSTHILLGKTAAEKDQIDLLSNKKLIFLAETDIQNFINKENTPFLLEEEVQESSQIESLKALMYSKNSADHDVVIELLRSGGVPKELITDLFLFYKYITNKKNSKKARKLLLLNASPALQEALKKRIRKLSSKSTDNLYEFAAGTELIQWKLNQYVYLNVENWVDGLAKNNLLGDALEQSPLEDRDRFLQAFLMSNKKTFDIVHWDYNINFEQYASALFNMETAKGISIFIPNWAKNKITNSPEGLAKMQQVERINFHFDFGHIDGRPAAELFELKNLRTLKMRDCKMTELPEELGNLQQLEVLDIGKNRLKKLPKNLSSLKKLKKLVIDKAFGPKVIADADAQMLQELLPSCEIIYN